MSATAPHARPAPAARLLRSFVILALVLYAGYLVRTISDDGRNWRPHLAIGAFLAGSSIGLAWLAKLAWTRIAAPAARLVATLGLAYHALFGVAMLVHRIRTEVTSNDDLVMRLWPHVVYFINSFE